MDKTKLQSLLISPDTTLKQAMQKLNETAEKILFVVDENNRLLGTITDGDIRRGIINGKQLTIPVVEIMTRKFISVISDSPDLQNRAKELMQKNLIEQIPVINELGIIGDVISWVSYLADKGKDVEQSLLENTVVIMAGGKGTRLDPFTKILPKPLIPLGNKPIIEHIMDHFYKNGFSRFILILNYKKEMIKMYFSENHCPYNIEFVDEKNYLGTAGGLSLLKHRLNIPFIVTNCDTILDGDYRDFFNWHLERKNLMSIVGSHREITVPYGVLSMENGSLVEINEKPKFDLFINTGTYVFEPDILDLVADNECLDMDKLINRIKRAHKDSIGVYPYWGKWFDIGQWDEYRKSLKHLGELPDDV